MKIDISEATLLVNDIAVPYVAMNIFGSMTGTIASEDYKTVRCPACVLIDNRSTRYCGFC